MCEVVAGLKLLFFILYVVMFFGGVLLFARLWGRAAHKIYSAKGGQRPEAWKNLFRTESEQKYHVLYFAVLFLSPAILVVLGKLFVRC